MIPFPDGSKPVTLTEALWALAAVLVIVVGVILLGAAQGKL